jgi:hypothetical protein
MKFGAQLAQYELPEWRGHYIPYKALEKALSRLAPQPLAELPSRETDQLSSRETDQLPSRETEDLAEAETEWCIRVSKEALRVGDFVDRGLVGLNDQVQQLSLMVDGLRIGGDAETGAAREDPHSPKIVDGNGLKGTKAKDCAEMEMRVMEGIGRVMEGMQNLRSFAELNHAALYKISKKHDKQIGSHTGLTTLFPKMVDESRLGDMSRFDALHAKLRELSLLSSHTEGLDASPEVARLAAGLGFKGTAAQGSSQNELLVSFFFGVSTSFLLSLVLLLWLPAKDAKSFSDCYFMAPFPVFRLVFSVLLVLWCLGFIAMACDKADINHMFILRVDPKCRVTSDFFFSRASMLTSLWILTFGMYVIDYKWEVLPTVWSKIGYNKRSSFHFVLYPTFLLVCTFVGLIMPSVICRNRYKCGVLRSVGRVAAAPLFSVDFGDNIVGDVLTSLSKPMQDIPPALCYLFQSHPQTEEMLEQFALNGHTCNEAAMLYVLPLLAGLPYLWRGLQCLRRYRDSVASKNTDIKHLFNFGKYMACLGVVLAGAICPSRISIVVVVSVVATAYAGFWDLAIDWGLGYDDLVPSASVDTSTGPSTGPWRRDCSEGSDMEQNGQSGKTRMPRRCLSRHVYWACSILDIMLRCTWVFTLMPPHIITKHLVRRVVWVSVISSAEVVRRSMWAVLRIENEQLSNASGFRALLWVPKRLNSGARRRPSLVNQDLGSPLLAS